MAWQTFTIRLECNITTTGEEAKEELGAFLEYCRALVTLTEHSLYEVQASSTHQPFNQETNGAPEQ